MWKLETILVLSTTVVTLLSSLLVSFIVGIKDAEKAKISKYMERLDIPIGEMAGDAGPGSMAGIAGAGGVSPFRIVGISVIIIGLMLFAVSPWIWSGGVFEFCLNIGMAGVLVVIGIVMTYVSRKKT